jgi:hypothetical protein
MKAYDGSRAILHSVLTSVLYGSEWPDVCTYEESELGTHLDGILFGPQDPSGHCGEENNYCHHQGSNPASAVSQEPSLYLILNFCESQF